MTTLFDVRHRYQNDVNFQSAVDVMQAMVMNLHLTPSEMREAAILASILVAERFPAPVHVTLGELELLRETVLRDAADVRGKPGFRP